MKRTLALRPMQHGFRWPHLVEATLAKAELAERAAQQLCPPGLTLLRQGVAAQEVYVVRQGLVKLLHTAANGRECVLGLRTAGEWLGCAAVTWQAAALFSAVTLTECEVYRLPRAAYLDWFRADSDFAWQQHRAQSYELLNHWQQAADLVCATARQRLEQTLWQFAQPQMHGHRSRNLRLQLPLQQQELASWLAITPSHLSRLFRELERAKLLRREKGWLVLPTPDKLWRGQHVGPAHDNKGAAYWP